MKYYIIFIMWFKKDSFSGIPAKYSWDFLEDGHCNGPVSVLPVNVPK